MVNNLIKRLQNIMRSDAGISGDAQRIEQMTWLFFLKVYDAQEEIWELDDTRNYLSIIPEELRWRNWAVDNADGEALTGDALLEFVNNKLFPTLKELQLTPESPRAYWIVKEVFADLNQYMKNGTLLRQVVNVVDEIDFSDAEDRHTFGDIYEGILKDLQSAGNAGEFYTPRALTDFIIQMLAPQLGETLGDFTSGTGGFLTSALNYLEAQVKTPQDRNLWQHAVIGQEWKPLPYLLSITNLLVHNIDEPNIIHCDSLGTPVSSFREKDKVNVIAMNPPYGGSTDAAAKMNFPAEMRSSETADLFMVLIMRRLKAAGRAGVIIPDGFLFGTDGAKLAIKTALLKEFNLHTIIRLPGSIFAPYTSIATNIVFFNNETADGAPEGYRTNKTWIYRLDMPGGYKHFSKTKPMKLEHCQPIIDWWNHRREIILIDEEGNVIDEKARCFTAEELINKSCNFDVCKFPKEDEEILPPAELLADYHQRRAALDKQIDTIMEQVEKGIAGISLEPSSVSAKCFSELATLTADLPRRLRQSILQQAIQGKLVPQDPNDEPASVLLEKAFSVKKKMISEKIVKADKLDTPVSEDEFVFELPNGWSWVRLNNVHIIARGGSPRPIKEYLTNAEDGVNWIKIGDTEKGGKYINSTQEKIKPSGVCHSRMIHKGDFLLTNSMSFGRPYISNVEGCIHDGWLVISPAYGIVFDQDYLYYLLSSPFTFDQFSGKVAGAVVQNLNSDKVATSVFPLPPLAEQHRIVAKIEQLFTEIDKLV